MKKEDITEGMVDFSDWANIPVNERTTLYDPVEDGNASEVYAITIKGFVIREGGFPKPSEWPDETVLKDMHGMQWNMKLLGVLYDEGYLETVMDRDDAENVNL